MKIEVGEYVRSRTGHFYKITRIDENGLIYWNKIQCGWSVEQLKDIVVKHSKNIIDLIEKGDYVNGNKVLAKERTVGIGVDTRVYLLLGNAKIIHNEDIKTIITKEQMESIEYKV